MYNVVALVGKAGVGKDTIMQEVLSSCSTFFNEIVSATTRPPREGEVDGKNYYFFSIEEFYNKVAKNEMLEWTEFNNWFYGTPLSALKKDKINIGVFNPAGIRLLSGSPQISLTIVYIIVDDKTRLIRQLNRENNPNIDEIIRRYSTDKEDFIKFEKEFLHDSRTRLVHNIKFSDTETIALQITTLALNALGQN